MLGAVGVKGTGGGVGARRFGIVLNTSDTAVMSGALRHGCMTIQSCLERCVGCMTVGVEVGVGEGKSQRFGIVLNTSDTAVMSGALRHGCMTVGVKDTAVMSGELRHGCMTGESKVRVWGRKSQGLAWYLILQILQSCLERCVTGV
ncbi:hypothetical protein RRG08_003996 [Elysia crispata]|uniref:Uncharacterized protein n=1 Tax=Elysia crispata TaxID=231223 RepID=A0AAE0Y6Y6_9GAST|nr:hypothetical protein RRG08_003996 [Elysia crispata]